MARDVRAVSRGPIRLEYRGDLHLFQDTHVSLVLFERLILPRVRGFDDGPTALPTVVNPRLTPHFGVAGYRLLPAMPDSSNPGPHGQHRTAMRSLEATVWVDLAVAQLTIVTNRSPLFTHVSS